MDNKEILPENEFGMHTVVWWIIKAKWILCDADISESCASGTSLIDSFL